MLFKVPLFEEFSYLKYIAGLRDRIHLFSAGITLGILSCCLSNKKELEALKGTQKQMENLIQDLQDELDMKEGLTVKELHNETSIDHEGKVSIISHRNFFWSLFKPKACLFL
jgi:hypothetical protein